MNIVKALSTLILYIPPIMMFLTSIQMGVLVKRTEATKKIRNIVVGALILMVISISHFLLLYLNRPIEIRPFNYGYAILTITVLFLANIISVFLKLLIDKVSVFYVVNVFLSISFALILIGVSIFFALNK